LRFWALLAVAHPGILLGRHRAARLHPYPATDGPDDQQSEEQQHKTTQDIAHPPTLRRHGSRCRSTAADNGRSVRSVFDARTCDATGELTLTSGGWVFIQIIQGQIKNASGVRATMDRWLRELEPGADGWLGGTFGITDGGMLVAVVRFESAEAARRNSDRPEQAVWWKEMEQYFTGAISFHDCRDVVLLAGGGSDDAKFVQVIQGHVRDKDRALALLDQSASMLSEHRPDVIGATIAIDDAGFFTETVSFVSESAARAAERMEMAPEMQKLVDEEMSLLEDVAYLDLRDPWFATHHS